MSSLSKQLVLEVLIVSAGFIVMLQHSRIRATYNIDGTAGGDCVQSLFCSRCTLMQDEWEIVAREERILLERKETEIDRQPGQQQQMRYSTSNLFEEVPDVFRPVAARGHNIDTLPRVSPPSPGDQETNVDEPLLQDVGHYKRQQNSNDGAASHNKARQPGHGPRKFAVRKSSPIGSALNPITRRSSSVDLRGRPSGSKIPQRSATNPSRPAALDSPVRHPSPNFLSYRSKGKGSDGILEMPAVFGTIKEEAKSEDFSSSIRSDVGVKSFALGSIYSGSSLRQGRSDARADESVIVYYGHEDRPQHHRLSDFSRFRPLTPEPSGTQVATFDGVAGRLESVDEDEGNAAEFNRGLDTSQAEAAQTKVPLGKHGDQIHGEELFAQLSTPTPVLRRFSISPSEVDNNSNVQAPDLTSQVICQDGGVKGGRSLGQAESLIRYLVDADKFFNIPLEWAKDSPDIPTERSNDPSNDSFKSIVEVSRSSDIMEAGVVVENLPKGCPDLSDNDVNNNLVGCTIEGVNKSVAEEGMAPETAYKLRHGESTVTDFVDSTSKALDNIADDWIEVSSLETFPARLGGADLQALEQTAPDRDLLSDDCDFISAEQRMSDAHHIEQETIEDGHMAVPLIPETASEFGDSHEQENSSILDATVAETTTQTDKSTMADKSSKIDVKDEASMAASDSLESTPQRTDGDKNLGGVRKSSKRSRNRRNRKRRTAAEATKAKT